MIILALSFLYHDFWLKTFTNFDNLFSIDYVSDIIIKNQHPKDESINKSDLQRATQKASSDERDTLQLPKQT